MDPLDGEQLSDLVHRLTDVELAVLLCLIAEQHCILTTEEAYLEHLRRQLELIGTDGFGLSTVAVRCSADMTLDQFASALLVESDSQRSSTLGISPTIAQDSVDSYFQFRRPDRARSASQGTADAFSPGRKIANVVLARDLHLASDQVQVQALELMRTKRLTTKTSVLTTPDLFLFVALLPQTTSRPALPTSLIQHFFISHYHPAEGFLDGGGGGNEPTAEEQQSDADSLASVVVRKPSVFSASSHALVPQAVVNGIRALVRHVAVGTDINRYILDIVVFLRMHRAVAGGVSAKATKDFRLLVQCLARLHSLDYVTPALVSLAAFKIYSHRIELVRRAEDERSMLWGSSAAGVQEYLKQVDVESVIEDVLAAVNAPL